MIDKKYLEQANKIIEETFCGKGFDDNLFNDLMCGNQQMNYSFLTTYLSCLKTNLHTSVPKLSYDELLENFLPNFKDSIKNLPDSLVGCSLMAFHKIYFDSFPEQQTAQHYQAIVNTLTTNDGPLCIDYKSAIAKHFPQYYKLKKVNKMTF